MDHSFVSIIVVNHNGGDHLRQCLESLASLSYPKESYEIMLVDNNSSDGSALAAKRANPSIKIFCNKINLGFCAANNLGAAEAKGDYIALINSDMRACRDWLFELVGAMKKADDVGAVGGKILTWDGDKLDFGDGLLVFDGHAFQKDEGRENAPGLHCKEKDILFPCGGNMLVRRDLFQAEGGFDEDFFAYLEDVDFGWRLWLHGYRVVYSPGAVVYHKSETTSSKFGIYKRGYLYEKNSFMVALKNYEDKTLKEVLSPMLLCMLHRTNALVRQKAANSRLILKDPFTQEIHGGTAASPRRAELSLEKLKAKYKELGCARLAARAFKKTLFLLRDKIKSRPGKTLKLDHPHLVEQFRAINYIMANLDKIFEKRRRVQASRVRSDREIFSRFPLYIVPTYLGDEELFNTDFFKSIAPGYLVSADLKEIMH